MSARVATLDDIEALRAEIMRETAPAMVQDDIASLRRWKRRLDQDAAVGRSLLGPQYIDDVAIRQGAITAEKLEATLVLATALIAGAVSPADRIQLDNSGIEIFGTVSSVANTKVVDFNTNGNFTLGVSPNQIGFTASTGVLTVPAAVITSLTIAAVGSGTIGGNYDTGSANPKLRLSTGGIEAWNAAGARTVYLNAASGAFTLSNDPSGSNRISLSDTGIELWKGGTREFYLRQGSGVEAVNMLLTGSGGGEYIGFQANTGIWTGASSFASAPFRVNTAGALTATSATITGAITATSGELQTLSVTGTLTLGGSGLFRSSSATTRVEIDTTGLYGYNAGTKRFQVLNNGSGFLGASTVLAWDSSGGLTLAGFSANSTTLSSGTGGSYVTMSSGSTAFSAGGATPSTAPFNVSNAGALTATSGAIGGWTIDSTNGIKLGTTTTTRGMSTGSTAFYAGDATPGSAPFRVTTAGVVTMTSATITGSITASSLTITGSATFSGGSLTLPSGGTITSSTLDMNSGTMANLTVDGTITLGSGGKIIDNDGSYWDQNGIVLVSSGSYGDAIRWRTSGTDTGTIYASSSAFTFIQGSSGAGGASMSLGSTNWSLFDVGATGGLRSNLGHIEANARFYPGTGSGFQSSSYIFSSFISGSDYHIDIQLSEAAGTAAFRVKDSGGTVVWGVNSDGQLILAGSDTTAEGTYAGRIPVSWNGGTKYISLRNA